MSALVGGRILPPIQPSVDWTTKLPASLGMMMNDTLGDCTCAGIYHAIQVWTANTRPAVETEPDANVELVYCQAGGYCPGDPSTDRGAAEQDVLGYWLNQGVPVYPSVGSTGDTFNKLTAFYEVDTRVLPDVARTIADCGISYIGFNVPDYLMANGVPQVWDYQGQDYKIEGGHCVVLPAYDFRFATSAIAGTFKVISWGQVYTMTTRFFSQFVDEAYGPVDADWVNNQGTTPLGLSLGELESQMEAIKV